MSRKEVIKLLKLIKSTVYLGNRKFLDALEFAINYLNQPEQRWILTSERFPEEGEEVLVYLFDGKSPYLAWIQDGLWCTEDFVVDADYEPVAWMPLPAPYKGGGQHETD